MKRLQRDPCGPSRVIEKKRKGIREIGKCNHSGFTLRQPRREWQDLITNVKEAG